MLIFNMFGFLFLLSLGSEQISIYRNMTEVSIAEATDGKVRCADKSLIVGEINGEWDGIHGHPHQLHLPRWLDVFPFGCFAQYPYKQRREISARVVSHVNIGPFMNCQYMSFIYTKRLYISKYDSLILLSYTMLTGTAMAGISKENFGVSLKQNFKLRLEGR